MRSIYGYGRGDLPCHTDFCFFRDSKLFLRDFDMFGDKISWDIVALTIILILLLITFNITLHVSIRRAL